MPVTMALARRSSNDEAKALAGFASSGPFEQGLVTAGMGMTTSRCWRRRLLFFSMAVVYMTCSF